MQTGISGALREEWQHRNFADSSKADMFHKLRGRGRALQNHCVDALHVGDIFPPAFREPPEKRSVTIPAACTLVLLALRVGSKIADENRTKLGELIGTVGARLLYEYDFGDGWQHELLLEEVLLGDETFQQTCVAGKRCCPPEDCGGPQGFAELLQALQDANHPSHDEACEWLGDFVPESFSADEVNRRLCRRKH
jgi:hypothetical protein